MPKVIQQNGSILSTVMFGCKTVFTLTLGLYTANILQENTADNRPNCTPNTADNRPNYTPNTADNRPNYTPNTADNRPNYTPNTADNRPNYTPNTADNRPNCTTNTADNRPNCTPNEVRMICGRLHNLCVCMKNKLREF
jgi:hypothetical protein